MFNSATRPVLLWAAQPIRDGKHQTREHDDHVGTYLPRQLFVAYIVTDDDKRPEQVDYSLLFMKPSRCSRLVNRLKMATNSVTVAMM